MRACRRRMLLLTVVLLRDSLERNQVAVVAVLLARANARREFPPCTPTAAQANGNGEGEQRYERRSSPRPQSGSPFSAVGLHHESEAMVQGRSRNMQKNRAGSNDVALPPPPPAPADDSNYDHAQSYYYETELSGAGNTVREGAQSLSPPPPKIWESPRPTPPVVDQYPTSAGTTSKETSPAPVTDSRSQQTPGIKPRMVTLLIEDRRLATDELVEVYVPLKTIGEGYLWADAKDVCAALQSGPSRIDGPAKVFTMRGKYRQTFLRVSADGEETTRSANLKVETDKTLPIVVEGVRVV
ncbi:hypothetical protein BJV77DRAFT_386473 [Russula vinacea]|nr:hypothetical protein BJV77DRAFT_386473 [Russula vinacea]